MGILAKTFQKGECGVTATVIGVFQDQSKADEALTALRSQLDQQNVDILVRSEQQSKGGESRTGECMNGFTREAIDLTSSAGNLMIRTLAFTANTMLTLPFRMMAPMVHGLTSHMDNTSEGKSMAGAGATGTTECMSNSMSGGMSGGIGGSMPGTQGEKVEITLQGEGDLKGVADILQNHGAVHVHTYMSNA